MIFLIPLAEILKKIWSSKSAKKKLIVGISGMSGLVIIIDIIYC